MREDFDALLEYAKNDAKFQEAVREHQAFQQLEGSPAWSAIKDLLARSNQALLDSIGKDIMSGRVIDQRRVDEVRGFIRGVQAVIDLPSVVEKRFNRGVDMAFTRAMKAQQTKEDS